jgi:hypothetical protein
MADQVERPVTDGEPRAVDGQARADDATRVPTERWRRLPERVAPDDMVESHETDPPPGNPPAAFDPDTSWLLRHS